MTDPAPSQTGIVPRAATIAAGVPPLLRLLWSVVLPAFLAVLLGATLRGVVDWLAVRTGLRASWLPALVALPLAAIAVGLAVPIGPALAQRSADLADTLVGEAGTPRQRYGDTEWGRRIPGRLQQAVRAGSGSFAAPAFRVPGGTLDVAATLVPLLIAAPSLAISPGLHIGGMLRLVPIRHRPRARAVMRGTGRTPRRRLLGQLADMAVVGVLAGLGLGLPGVPVTLAPGAVAGLPTFIPCFGAVPAGVPAVPVAPPVGPHPALLTPRVLLLAHLVDGDLVSPLIQRRMVVPPPAATVTATTAAGTVAVRELSVSDTLGDDEVRARP